jgi:hypothetical protein
MLLERRHFDSTPAITAFALALGPPTWQPHQVDNVDNQRHTGPMTNLMTTTNYLEPVDGRCIPCHRPWSNHKPDCPNGCDCEYPGGCRAAAMPGSRLCQRHYVAVWALVGTVPA